MNKTELLQDLSTKVIKMIGTPVMNAEAHGLREYTQRVLEQQGHERAGVRTIAFTVVDEGDPAEAAYYRDSIALPKGDNDSAMAYLAGLVSTGAIDRFQVEDSRPDLGPFSFFNARVWVDDGTGKLSEKRIQVTRNADGNATHKEIV